MLENRFATGAPPWTLLGELTVLAGRKKGSLPLPKNTTPTLGPFGLELSKAFNITEVSEKVISSTYNARTLTAGTLPLSPLGELTVLCQTLLSAHFSRTPPPPPLSALRASHLPPQIPSLKSAYGPCIH